MGAFTDIITDLNTELASQAALRDPVETSKTVIVGSYHLAENHDGSKIIAVPTSSDYGPARFQSSVAKVIATRSLVVDFYCFGDDVDGCLTTSEDLLEALQSLYASDISLGGDRWPTQDEKAQFNWSSELVVVQVAFSLAVYGRAYKTATANTVKHTETPTPSAGELTCKP